LISAGVFVVASAYAAAMGIALKDTVRLAVKNSVLRRLRPDELTFISLQDNGKPAGKPSPYFKSQR